MSQAHLDRLLTDYAVGLDADQLPVTVGDLGLEAGPVLALADEYKFLPADSYCPWSGVPSWVSTVGVHVQGSDACIAIDNGMCLVCWLLKA